MGDEGKSQASDAGASPQDNSRVGQAGASPQEPTSNTFFDSGQMTDNEHCEKIYATIAYFQQDAFQALWMKGTAEDFQKKRGEVKNLPSHAFVDESEPSFAPVGGPAVRTEVSPTSKPKAEQGGLGVITGLTQTVQCAAKKSKKKSKHSAE